MIIKTEAELQDFLANFNKLVFAFDTETTGLRQDTLEIVGLSLYDGEHSCYIVLDKDLKHSELSIDIVKPYLKDLFGNKQCLTIAHNWVYDARVLSKYGIDMYQCNIIDTMIAHHLIDERQRHGLKHLTKEVLGREVVEFDSVGDNLYSEEFYKYGEADAINTWDLWREFKPQIEELDLAKLFLGVEMPFQRVLLEMSLNGMLVDAQKHAKFKTLLERDIEVYLQEMSRQIGLKCELQNDLFGNYVVIPPINFDSSQQIAKVLFEELGLKPVEYTPTGQASVGKKTKEHYKQHPFMQIYNEYTSAVKLLSSFVEPMPKFIQEDGKIRTELLDHGAKTGRLSSRNMNLQQLPKPKSGGYEKINFRELYIASPGYKMIAVDYGQQELRVLAQISNCKGLIEAFNSGHDFHSYTAEQMNKTRTEAKAINFGIAYRKSAWSFAKDWGVEEDEAQEVLDAYFEKHPEVKALMEESDRKIYKHGYLRTIAGRYRRFDKHPEGYYPRSVLRQGFNFLVQGASADITRIGCIKVQRYARAHPEYDVRLLLTVHDELVVECKEEYAEQVREDLEKVFASAVTKNFKVPLLAEASIGNNYAEVK